MPIPDEKLGGPPHMDRENDPRKPHVWKLEKLQKIQLLRRRTSPTPTHKPIPFFGFFGTKKNNFSLEKSKAFFPSLKRASFLHTFGSKNHRLHTTTPCFLSGGRGGGRGEGEGGSKSKLVPLRARSCSWWRRSNFPDWKKNLLGPRSKLRL